MNLIHDQIRGINWVYTYKTDQSISPLEPKSPPFTPQTPTHPQKSLSSDVNSERDCCKHELWCRRASIVRRMRPWHIPAFYVKKKKQFSLFWVIKQAKWPCAYLERNENVKVEFTPTYSVVPNSMISISPVLKMLTLFFKEWLCCQTQKWQNH